MPGELVRILEDESIVKAGINILHAADLLFTTAEVKLAGFVVLGLLAKIAQPRYHSRDRPVGLRELMFDVFEQNAPDAVSAVDWVQRPLCPDATRRAASECQAQLTIFEFLTRRMLESMNRKGFWYPTNWYAASINDRGQRIRWGGNQMALWHPEECQWFRGPSDTFVDRVAV